MVNTLACLSMLSCLGDPKVYNLPIPFLPGPSLAPTPHLYLPLSTLLLLLKHRHSVFTNIAFSLESTLNVSSCHCFTLQQLPRTILSPSLPWYVLFTSLAHLFPFLYSPLFKSVSGADELRLILILKMDQTISVSGDGANSVITFEGTFKFTALDRNENWVGIIAQVKNAARCRQADDAHKWYVITRLCLHPLFCPTTNTVAAPPNTLTVPLTQPKMSINLIYAG